MPADGQKALWIFGSQSPPAAGIDFENPSGPPAWVAAGVTKYSAPEISLASMVKEGINFTVRLTGVLPFASRLRTSRHHRANIGGSGFHPRNLGPRRTMPGRL